MTIKLHRVYEIREASDCGRVLFFRKGVACIARNRRFTLEGRG